MNDALKKFLEFDLGHMDENKFQNKILDIEYSQNPKLNLDIYFPENKSENYPVFIILYGGGWASGFKKDKFVEPMLKPLKYGYACVVIDYSLTVDEPFPQNVIDIKHAIDFVYKNQKKYQFDTNKIILWGESAGAHLALEAGLISDEELELNDLQTKVSDIVAMYPAIDLYHVVDDFKTLNLISKETFETSDMLLKIMMGEHFDDLKYQRLVNPTNFIDEESPRIFMQHGNKDVIVPYIQSKHFYEKAKNIMKNDIYYELVDGKIHTDSWFFSDENVKKMIGFIK